MLEMNKIDWLIQNLNEYWLNIARSIQPEIRVWSEVILCPIRAETKINDMNQVRQQGPQSANLQAG